jgi:Na+/H+-translocating membrane pyrophosphatase
MKSQTGPAPVIIQGLGVGMIGTAFPVFIVALTIIVCYYIEGL